MLEISMTNTHELIQLTDAPHLWFGFLALLIFLSRWAGVWSEKLGAPTVLGELFMGMALAQVWPELKGLQHHSVFRFFEELGALLLLFEVGWESSLGELRRVGAAAARVAVAGVVVPVLMGTALGWIAHPHWPWVSHVFLGATLAATSVGITARVLRDLGQAHSPEAKVILSAAVFDDILGLLLLAAVTAWAQASWGGAGVGGTGANAAVGGWGAQLLPLALKMTFFIILCVASGPFLIRPAFHPLARRMGQHGSFILAFVLCLALGALAPSFGLAPIMGAFFAGLALRPSETQGLKIHLESWGGVIIPLFFVLMGLKVDWSGAITGHNLFFAAALTAVAILGKIVAGGLAGTKADPWIVGVGMIPRGEVGLIFASMGAQTLINGTPLLTPELFSAVVIMVTVTTALAPFWLQARLKQRARLKR